MGTSPGSSLLNARRVACAVLCVVLAGTATIASGYDYDYDYPGHGADWYGRSGGPDPRRDYPAFAMDEFSAGDDYGLGYDPAVDIFGFGPPLGVTQTRHFDFHFRFSSMVGCFEPMNCYDGSFCNGEDYCWQGSCYHGDNPCVDSDPCTLDLCDDDTDTCDFPPVPPPDEVAGLRVDPSSPGSTVTTLSWSEILSAEWYNVYRGEQTDLGDLACFIGNVAMPSVDDDGTVPSSGIYAYLVTAVACDLESTIGESRPNPVPCP